MAVVDPKWFGIGLEADATTQAPSLVCRAVHAANLRDMQVRPPSHFLNLAGVQFCHGESTAFEFAERIREPPGDEQAIVYQHRVCRVGLPFAENDLFESSELIPVLEGGCQQQGFFSDMVDIGLEVQTVFHGYRGPAVAMALQYLPQLPHALSVGARRHADKNDSRP